MSHDICLSLSDLLHSAWQSLGLSMLLQMALFRSFLWLSNIPLYIWCPFHSYWTGGKPFFLWVCVVSHLIAPPAPAVGLPGSQHHHHVEQRVLEASSQSPHVCCHPLTPSTRRLRAGEISWVHSPTHTTFPPLLLRVSSLCPAVFRDLRGTVETIL